MKLLVLSLLLIGVAGLERAIYKKKDKALVKIRLFLDILIICLLVSISYFITDTTIGTLYVFSGIFIFILIGVINSRSNIKRLKYSSYIIGLPFVVFLLIKAIQSILTDPLYIFLMTMITNGILSWSNEHKWTKREYISVAIGFAFAMMVLFSYYKLSGSENRIMMKQEIVAQKYLEEELDMHGFEVYLRRSSVGLRGEESTVRAYGPSGTIINMIYKDNRIISYDIEDSD